MQKIEKKDLPLRIAIIGCGRITEIGHLPAVLSLPSVKLTVLVDTDLSRAKILKQTYAINCEVADDFRRVANIVDSVIIATPNSSHYEVAAYFLENGIHSLVEKPLTIDPREANHLSEISELNNCVLSVGYVTRFFPSTILMKEMIDKKYFGHIERFDYEFGSIGGWSPVSGYNLTRDSSGGGVLVVSGSHFLDRLIYWFGYPEIIECSSDSHGGVEANFKARLLFKQSGGEEFTGTLFVSKTDKLRNSFRLTGQNYDVELPEGQDDWIKVTPKNYEKSFEYRVFPKRFLRKKSEYQYFILQLKDFVESIKLKKKPVIDGREGSKSVRLLAELYKKAGRLSEPWLLVDHRTHGEKVRRPTEKILVTGASGFVGGALCERLYFDNNCQFRAMIHNTGNAGRIARLPIEIVKADLLNKEEVYQSVKSCSKIVNLVRGGVAVDTKGLKNLLNAALEYKVNRFLHVSSVAVYGDNPPPGSEREEFPPDPSGNKYGELKLKQEQIVQKYVRKGLPCVILRPPNIYGPFSSYTLMMLDRIKSKRVFLLDKGKNPCNVVHVYNLIDAILLALEVDEAVGKTYFVTDGEPIIWKDFIEANIEMVGSNAVVSEVCSEDLRIRNNSRLSFPESALATFKFLLSGELRNYLSKNVPLLRALNSFVYERFQLLNSETQQRIRKLLSKPVVIDRVEDGFVEYDAFVASQNRKVRHSIDRAQEELGYVPRMDLRSGIENTRSWLVSANHIPFE